MNSTQDWFVMTGDLILNLGSNKTGDSFRFHKQPNEKITAFGECKSLKRSLEDKNPELCTSNESDQLLLETCFDPESIQHLQLQQQLTSPNQCSDSNAAVVVSNPTAAVAEDVFSVSVENGFPNNDQCKSEEESHDKPDKSTFASGISSSSSGNSSGIIDEELSNSHSFSDSLSLSSPSKHCTSDSRTLNEKYSPEEFCYYYDEHYDGKQEVDNCYENIGECNYLSKSHESNLYNLIEDSKSFDNISIDSESGSMVELSSGKHQQCIDAPSANRLAKRLFNLEGFQKCDVTRHLSKNNDYSRAVAEEYLRLFDFTGQSLDVALRAFLSRFYLTGETQERERVLVYFSKRFHECNPDANFESIDSIHTLTCALMLLNTDLHEGNIQRKMTCSDFIMNLSGMNDGTDYQSELLKYLYYSIKQKPLGWNNDDLLDANKSSRNVFSKITTISKSISSPYATLPRKFNNTLCSNPFVELPNPTFAIEYKKGYIRRKCCYEPNGRKTPIGRRGWRMFYCTIRDLVLYLHKDENGFRKSQLQESFANSIRIHHAIAELAKDYPKKKFVFRLITADYAEYLFETSDSRELQSWVDTINTTAASLSAPALPMAVSSDSYTFKREILPVSHTKLSLRDQLNDQENKLLSLQMELEMLLEKSGRNSTNKIYHKDFVEKENYLQHEVKRYRMYISCLKWKLKQRIAASATEQCASSEHQSIQDCNSLHKSSSAYSDRDSSTSS